MQLDSQWGTNWGLWPKMRCERAAEFEKGGLLASAYTLLATFAVNLLLALLCAATVLGIGTWGTLVWSHVFSLDKRSIALGRIVLGCISHDFLFSHKYALCFYTDLGMWPRTLILRMLPSSKKKRFSPYMAISTYLKFLFVFLCWIIVA